MKTWHFLSNPKHKLNMYSDKKYFTGTFGKPAFSRAA